MWVCKTGFSPANGMRWDLKDAGGQGKPSMWKKRGEGARPTIEGGEEEEWGGGGGQEPLQELDT